METLTVILRIKKGARRYAHVLLSVYLSDHKLVNGKAGIDAQ